MKQIFSDKILFPHMVRDVYSPAMDKNLDKEFFSLNQR